MTQNDNTIIVSHFGQRVTYYGLKFHEDKIRAATNIVLAIGGLNGFVSTKVQNSTSVLRIKFSAKNPAHRQYAAR